MDDALTWAVLALTLAAVVFYVAEWFEVEVTSLLVLAAVLILFEAWPARDGQSGPGIGAGRLLDGFSNPALITVLALLVVGEAMVRTGALDTIGQLASRLGGSPLVALGVAFAIVVLLSAVMNNTPVVVIFIPILQAMAQRQAMTASRVMIPLSYAAILGGMTTLMGSSTNLLVSSTLQAQGFPALGFFEFTVIGGALAAVGLVYVLVVLPWILPDRSSLASGLTGHGKQYIAQIVVPQDSDLVGQSAIAGQFKALPDITVRLIQRGEHAELPPFDDIVVQPGDVLVVAATRSALTDAAARHPGLLHPPARGGPDAGKARLKDTDPDDAPIPTGRDQVLVEAMVTPSSRMIGQALEQYAFRQRFRCLVLGVQRRARMVRAALTELRLEPGDTLLVQGSRESIDALRAERDLVVLSGSAVQVPNRGLSRWTLAVFLATVGLSATGVVPILHASFVAAVTMVLMGAVNLRQAGRALDRKIVLVVAAALALGEALQQTGGAAAVAQGVLAAAGDLGPAGVVSVLFLLVAMFTNVLSNNACAVLFTPIGISLAPQLGLDPRILAVTVLLAANCSFASPVGYQTNLLVLGPGNYRFSDFARAGLPLLVVLWLVFTVLAPLYWGL